MKNDFPEAKIMRRVALFLGVQILVALPLCTHFSVQCVTRPRHVGLGKLHLCGALGGFLSGGPRPRLRTAGVES